MSDSGFMNFMGYRNTVIEDKIEECLERARNGETEIRIDRDDLTDDEAEYLKREIEDISVSGHCIPRSGNVLAAHRAGMKSIRLFLRLIRRLDAFPCNTTENRDPGERGRTAAAGRRMVLPALQMPRKGEPGCFGLGNQAR